MDRPLVSAVCARQVIAAANVSEGFRVLDVSTGTGEAARAALPIVGSSGVVVGADISVAMLEAARVRLQAPRFWPVAADGQAMPFADATLRCRDLPSRPAILSPAAPLGLSEFRRIVSAVGRKPALCVIVRAEVARRCGACSGRHDRSPATGISGRRCIVSFALGDPWPTWKACSWHARLLADVLHRASRRAKTLFQASTTIGSPVLKAAVGSIAQAYLTLSRR